MRVVRYVAESPMFILQTTIYVEPVPKATAPACDFRTLPVAAWQRLHQRFAAPPKEAEAHVCMDFCQHSSHVLGHVMSQQFYLGRPITWIALAMDANY